MISLTSFALTVLFLAGPLLVHGDNLQPRWRPGPGDTVDEANTGRGAGRISGEEAADRGQDAGPFIVMGVLVVAVAITICRCITETTKRRKADEYGRERMRMRTTATPSNAHGYSTRTSSIHSEATEGTEATTDTLGGETGDDGAVFDA